MKNEFQGIFTWEYQRGKRFIFIFGIYIFISSCFHLFKIFDFCINRCEAFRLFNVFTLEHWKYIFIYDLNIPTLQLKCLHWLNESTLFDILNTFICLIDWLKCKGSFSDSLATNYLNMFRKNIHSDSVPNSNLEKKTSSHTHLFRVKCRLEPMSLRIHFSARLPRYSEIAQNSLLLFAIADSRGG